MVYSQPLYVADGGIRRNMRGEVRMRVPLPQRVARSSCPLPACLPAENRVLRLEPISYGRVRVDDLSSGKSRLGAH